MLYGVHDDNDPRTWTLDIPEDRVNLYKELKNAPRELTPAEAEMMVELVDAWRGHEQRKHIALMEALRPKPASS